MCSRTFCVCVWSFHTWAPPNSAVAELVDRATWQSAFSCPWLMACWRLLLMKMRSPPPARLFALSAVTGTHCQYREGVCVAIRIHINENPSTGGTFGFECLCVYVYSTACWGMHVENLHKLQAYSKVNVCLRYINLFMNRDIHSTCKCAHESTRVNVCAYTRWACVRRQKQPSLDELPPLML